MSQFPLVNQKLALPAKSHLRPARGKQMSQYSTMRGSIIAKRGNDIMASIYIDAGKLSRGDMFINHIMQGSWYAGKCHAGKYHLTEILD